MRILGIPGDKGACAYYRVKGPLYAIRDAGLAHVDVVEQLNGDTAVTWGQVPPQEREQLVAEVGLEKAMETLDEMDRLYDASTYDLLLMQRTHTGNAHKVMKLAQNKGIAVVFDIDDDALTVPATNPSYAYWGKDARKVLRWWQHYSKIGRKGPEEITAQGVKEYTRGLLNGLLTSIRIADLTTVTTPHLRETYRRYNRKVTVLPNQMVARDWQNLAQVPHPPEEVWIGWAGTNTHLEDLLLLKEVLPQVLSEYPHVRFYVLGFPEVIDYMPRLPAAQVRPVPWMPMDEYRGLLASMDVIVAPSKACPFNEGKSDIRVLEAWMCGVPVLASPTTYGKTVKEAGGGYVCKNPGDWLGKLRALIENEMLRKNLGEKGLHYAQTRTYDRHVHVWWNAFVEVLSQVRGMDRKTMARLAA